MTQKITKILIFFLVLAILVVPLFSFAADPPHSGLVPPCGEDPDTGQCIWGFKELMSLIYNVIRFILFKMVVPIAAIMFAYAGFLMVTSGGSVEQAGKARTIFTNVALGLIIAVIAFLVIKTLLSILGFEGGWIGF